VLADRGALIFRKASACEAHSCLLVAVEPGRAHVRDSKAPDGPSLIVGAPQWRAFIAGVKAGQFDLS
jgi:hypothetical protein